MRNAFIVLLLNIFTNIAFCQDEIAVSFNSTYAGRNISLDIANTKSKNEFGVGIRVNINKLAHNDDQNKSYYKRLYATELYHFGGLHFFYNRMVFTDLKNISPFLFYDMQATFSTTRNRMFLPYGYDTDGAALYKEVIEIFGPYGWIEQTVGIGIKTKIFNNFYLNQKIGFGTCILLGYDKKRLDRYYNWFGWEFGAILNIGLIYKFGL